MPLTEGGDRHQQLRSTQCRLARINPVKISRRQRDQRVKPAVTRFLIQNLLVKTCHFPQKDRIPTRVAEFRRNVMIPRPAAKLIFRQLRIKRLPVEANRLRHQETTHERRETVEF